MRIARVACFALLILVLGACSYVNRDLDPYQPPLADRAEPNGKTLYMRDCAWCHGSDGGGTQQGPDLQSGTNGPALTHFVLSTGRMPLDDPQERSKRTEPVYNSEEIDAIVDYVAEFSAEGPEIPLVDEEIGATPAGLELYQEHCAACHAPTGVGAAITSGTSEQGDEFGSSVAAPPLDESTRLEVAEAIRTGPGTMPVFGESILTSEEVDEIVGYVDYLQKPDDRGGAPIGRVGPVAEGAIGWALGILALILLIRWMGTKAGEE